MVNRVPVWYVQNILALITMFIVIGTKIQCLKIIQKKNRCWEMVRRGVISLGGGPGAMRPGLCLERCVSGSAWSAGPQAAHTGASHDLYLYRPQGETSAFPRRWLHDCCSI